MTKISRRAFSNEADIQAMVALVYDNPDSHLHVMDLPYRLSSWALDFPDNVALWFDAQSQLSAWAVMQTPFWTIDCAIRPGADEGLHWQLLTWADDRARQLLHSPSGQPIWFVNLFADETERIRDLEEFGFVCQADGQVPPGDQPWSKVLMRRSAQTQGVVCALPAGFALRPLAGESEVEAYVELHRAVFESRNMTVEWRTRTLRYPQHVADLDLVAVAPDGQLVAFCICWLCQGAGEGAAGQIEPLGVHAGFRKLGLGRAILAEGLRRLHLCGASRTYVETDNYRGPALQLYESVGFRVIRDVLVFRKDYAP